MILFLNQFLRCQNTCLKFLFLKIIILIKKAFCIYNVKEFKSKLQLIIPCCECNESELLDACSGLKSAPTGPDDVTVLVFA